jgi:hypothetical protein
MTKRLRPEVSISGPKSIFRRKVRAPVCITLTNGHHFAVATAMRRLGVSRSDLFGLFVDQFSTIIQRNLSDSLAAAARAHVKMLPPAVEAVPGVRSIRAEE